MNLDNYNKYDFICHTNKKGPKFNKLLSILYIYIYKYIYIQYWYNLNLNLKVIIS